MGLDHALAPYLSSAMPVQPGLLTDEKTEMGCSQGYPVSQARKGYRHCCQIPNFGEKWTLIG